MHIVPRSRKRALEESSQDRGQHPDSDNDAENTVQAVMRDTRAELLDGNRYRPFDERERSKLEDDASILRLRGRYNKMSVIVQMRVRRVLKTSLPAGISRQRLALDCSLVLLGPATRRMIWRRIVRGMQTVHGLDTQDRGGRGVCVERT